MTAFSIELIVDLSYGVTVSIRVSVASTWASCLIGLWAP